MEPISGPARLGGSARATASRPLLVARAGLTEGEFRGPGPPLPGAILFLGGAGGAGFGATGRRTLRICLWGYNTHLGPTPRLELGVWAQGDGPGGRPVGGSRVLLSPRSGREGTAFAQEAPACPCQRRLPRVASFSGGRPGAFHWLPAPRLGAVTPGGRG